MSFQILFGLYLIATTTNSLLTRRYASGMQLHPLLSAIPTNITVAIPLSLAFALASGGLIIPSLGFVLLSFIEGLIGTAYGFVSMNAQKYSDAATFATLSKLQVILVIIFSGLFLGESLTLMQLIGSSLLLVSGFIVTGSLRAKGLTYNFIGIVLLSIVVILGRTLVLASNVGTTLLLGTIFGLINKLVMQGSNLRANYPALRLEYRQRFVMSIAQFLQILLFSVSVDVIGNVGLVSSLASIKVVTVMAASYIFLRERDDLLRKIVAAIIAVVGLLLL